MTLRSMTGFAASEGESGDRRWRWELKSVNGRGLDMRFRLPNRLESMENDLRKRASALLTRGSLTSQLTVERAGAAQSGLNEAAAATTMADLVGLRAEAERQGLPLAPISVESLLNLRQLFQDETQSSDLAQDGDLVAAVLAGYSSALGDLAEMREREGAALSEVLSGQLDAVEADVNAAIGAAEIRDQAVGGRLRERVSALLAADAGVDEARLAQELALIAVKADVREEIDRLHTHVAAARALLREPPPIGRKLDFLMQEFNREANTLCSKAGAAELTEIGLRLKVTIDQMREQVQNVE